MSIIDCIIFFSFLGILFLLNHDRSYKFINLELYIYKNNKISNFALFVMMFYTILSTTVFNIPQENNNILELFSIEQILSYIAKTLIIYHLIKKIFLHKKSLSIADIIGQYYGPWSKFITGVLGLSLCVVLIILQFKLIYQAINILFIVDFNPALLSIPFCGLYYLLFVFNKTKSLKLIALLIILPIIIYYLCIINQKLIIYVIVISIFLYSSISKNRNSQFRSLINFSFTVIFLPIIFSQINVIDNQNNIFFSNDILIFNNLLIFNDQNIIIFAITFLSILISSINPILIYNIQLAKSIKQAKKIFLLSSIAVFIFIHLINCLIPLYKHIISIPHNNLNIIIYLAEYVMCSKTLKGLVFSGIISIVFGIMDRIINTANTFLIHDIINNDIFLNFKKQHNNIVSISTVLIGLLCFVLSMQIINFNTIFNIILNIWLTIVPIPFIACIYGIKIHKKAFYYSGLSNISIYPYYYLHNIDTLQNNIFMIVCITVNTIIFMLVKYEQINKQRTLEL